MNKDLEKKLIDEFPMFFVDMYGDPMKTCMHWGCTCGDGWFNIIYEACKKIAAVDKGTFKFTQIKEKFGGLRLYGPGDHEIVKIINAAEIESYKVCEQCGKRENITTEGSWVQTLCKDCR
jgi:hypothetical protein